MMSRARDRAMERHTGSRARRAVVADNPGRGRGVARMRWLDVYRPGCRTSRAIDIVPSTAIPWRRSGSRRGCNVLDALARRRCPGSLGCARTLLST
jgi:hypothetical protein